LGANPFSFFSSIYVGEGWSLILSSPRMTVAATVTAREEEGKGPGQGRREVTEVSIERGFKSRWSDLWWAQCRWR
jgi:hypothetical protein